MFLVQFYTFSLYEVFLLKYLTRESICIYTNDIMLTNIPKIMKLKIYIDYQTPITTYSLLI